MKNKTTAGLLALFLGGLGVHQFYLGNGGKGALYLFFCFTGIPLLISIFDGISLLTMSDEVFNLKYNRGYDYPVRNFEPKNNLSLKDLEKAKKMREEGIITEEEFQKIKQKVLD